MVPMNSKILVQNESLIDRSLRVIAGCLMLVVPLLLLVTTDTLSHIWLSLSMLLSIYFILSGVIGVDPLYYLFNKKSCDLTERNRCGTLPSQYDAMFHYHHQA